MFTWEYVIRAVTSHGILIGCVVRRAFWLAGRKYEGVLGKPVSIKKLKKKKKTAFPSFVEIFFRTIL